MTTKLPTTTPARSINGSKTLLWAAALLFIGVLLTPYIARLPLPTQVRPSPTTGPTSITRINDQVVGLRWDGTPQSGYVLSDALAMRIGDRVEIVWLGGNFSPFPGEAALQPWGFFDALPESRHLFRFTEGAYAIHILQGDRGRIVWPRGIDRIVFVVEALPVRLYYNTIISPGVAYSPSARRDVAIDGYAPPLGNMLFRVVNRR